MSYMTAYSFDSRSSRSIPERVETGNEIDGVLLRPTGTRGSGHAQGTRAHSRRQERLETTRELYGHRLPGSTGGQDAFMVCHVDLAAVPGFDQRPELKI